MKYAYDLLRNDSGVTSIEYALLGALIAGMIVVGVGNAGTAVGTLYEHVASCVRGATTNASANAC